MIEKKKVSRQTSTLDYPTSLCELGATLYELRPHKSTPQVDPTSRPYKIRLRSPGFDGTRENKEYSKHFKIREIECLLINTSKTFPACGLIKTANAGLHSLPIKKKDGVKSAFDP